MTGLASQLGFNATDKRSITEMLGTRSEHPLLQKKGDEQGGGGLPLDPARKNKDGTRKIMGLDEDLWKNSLNETKKRMPPTYRIRNTSVEEVIRIYVKNGKFHVHDNTGSGAVSKTKHLTLRSHDGEVLIFILPTRYALETFPITEEEKIVVDELVVEEEKPKEKKEKEKEVEGELDIPFYPTVTSPPLSLDIIFKDADIGPKDPNALTMTDYDQNQIDWIIWFLQEHEEVQIAFLGYSDGGGLAGKVAPGMKDNPYITYPKTWADLAYKRSWLASKLFEFYVEPHRLQFFMDPVVSPAAGKKSCSIYLKGPSSPEIVRDYNRMAKALGWPQYSSK